MRLSKTPRGRLERGVILAATLGLHGLVLFLLTRPVALVFPDRSTNEGAIEVSLDRSRRSTRPTARSETTALAPHRPSLAAPSIVEALPAPAAPPGLAPAIVGATPGSQGGLAAALRAGGYACAGGHNALLSPEERARCQEKLGALALNAPPLPAPIDPAKRAYYDAVAEAYRNPGQMVPLTARGGRGMFAVDDNVFPGHGPRVGCSVKFGPNADKAPKGPPNALRAGPCFIQPPVGSLTPEGDIRKPF
ncbi:hypothetical protein ASD21_06740 [Caulobacter sp. Root1455]|nr:hypothetical protein ASD21_06740 [Caulobacter sp. Root1455]